MVRFNYGSSSNVMTSVYSVGAFLLKAMVVSGGNGANDRVGI